jgi:hypothetical protein
MPNAFGVINRIITRALGSLRSIAAERDLKSIVVGLSKFLSASDVPFRRLHRRVTEKKLNLLKFASRSMAEASAGATKIVGRQMVKADSLGVTSYRIPDHIRLVQDGVSINRFS